MMKPQKTVVASAAAAGLLADRVRILGRLDADYRGLRAVLGARRFITLTTAYLARYPSDSHALRDLGTQLERFLREGLHWATRRERLALDMVRFESAQVCALDAPARPVITPDPILDSPLSKLRLGLQPYLTLLRLDYAVDDFLIALEKCEADARRGKASNGVDPAPKSGGRSKRIQLPKREEVFLAVYRYDRILHSKRLDMEGFLILAALSLGETVEKACFGAVKASLRTDINWPVQIKEWFSSWSALGWFCRPAQSSRQHLF
jgi:hypothetical protein